MKLSARNMIKGEVVDVRKDAVSAQVRVDIGGGNVITSTITADSADRLGLEQGREAIVLIKASDVMLAVED